MFLWLTSNGIIEATVIRQNKTDILTENGNYASGSSIPNRIEGWYFQNTYSSDLLRTYLNMSVVS